MTMLNRLDENVSKLSLLDLNVSIFFLFNENVSNYFLEENVYNFFGPKCEYVSIKLKRR